MVIMAESMKCGQYVIAFDDKMNPVQQVKMICQVYLLMQLVYTAAR